MTNPLIQKLNRFTQWSADDRASLDALTSGKVRQLAANQYIAHEGSRPPDLTLIVSGWACRYRILPDGRRQIVSFLLPGDLCNLHSDILREMNYSIVALTALSVTQFGHHKLEALTRDHPGILRALRWDSLVSAAIQREWTVNIGRRSATERLAHLMLELHYRLKAVGLVEKEACALPLTQTEIADVLGLTSVHTNRVIQSLRKMGVLELGNGRLIIHDRPALEHIAMFNPHYLDLPQAGAHLNADGYVDE